MRSAIAAFVMAVIATAFLTPLARRLALAVGAVDEPGARRVHTRRVPRMGGIAIVLGFFAPLIALAIIGTHAGLVLSSAPRFTAGLLVGAGLIVAAGLLDDARGIGAKTKLAIQVAAAAAAFVGGMRIDSVDLPLVGTFHLGVLALPATIIWIVGIVNAINLIDGLDGLAAGVTFFACLTNFAIASLTGNLFILVIAASLGGAVVGFLFYNFNPAQIFMGDSGSLFLGFVLACMSLAGAGTQKSPTLVAIVVPILALGLPIMDLLLTIARRFLERRSVFSADRGHIHHRLLDMGLTHRRAVFSLYLLSVAFTVVALVVYFGRSWQIGAALFSLTALLVGVVRFVGYFGSTLVKVNLSADDAPSEILRRSVPRALARIAVARAADQLPAILAQLGSEGGLLAVGLLNSDSKPLQRWEWSTPQGAREATCVTFPVAGGRQRIELQFYIDSPMGTVGPQTRILLQLVADAAEALLATPHEATRPVMASSPEPVLASGPGRIAQGGS
jgi:UDP-GlcNAc:undecaprenyl-phosphate/decaprenyl-phosphate GlcNAc-1-phosphate transferase